MIMGEKCCRKQQFLSSSRPWPESEPTSPVFTTMLKSRWSFCLSVLTPSGVSSWENLGQVHRKQTFHIYNILLAGRTSYLLGLDIFAIHPDIYSAGVPAAWNEENSDSSAAEEQKDHPWHHHPVLQVSYYFNYCLFVFALFCPLLLLWYSDCSSTLLQLLWSRPQQRHQPVHHDLATPTRK